MNDWIKAIFNIAPTVATALGTPLAGAAIAAIGNVLGMSEPTTDKIAKAFADGQIRPEDIVKIKALELEFKTHESEMGYKYADLEYKKSALVVEDRKDARAMQIATKALTPTVLSYGIMAAGGGMIAAVLFGYARVDEVLAGTLIGYVVSEMKAVSNFWLGSSNSSQAKDVLLANSTPVK
jgi:hypothetical protein